MERELATLVESIRNAGAKVRELDALGMETYRMRQADTRTIEELQAHRTDRDRQIASLQGEVQELRSKQAQDLKETIELREAVEALRAENKAAKNVIKKLLLALAERDIDIPELNGDIEKLGDSVKDLVVRKPK